MSTISVFPLLKIENEIKINKSVSFTKLKGQAVFKKPSE